MKRSPQDWTQVPSDPEPKMPPQLVTRTRLLEEVIIRRRLLEADDKSLADPLGQWRRVR